MTSSADACNYLVIVSDEHRRDAMGCAGHPVVQTPNLDALAARGTIFEKAYTPSPMCVPARAALACGDHVHRLGNWDSATAYDGSVRSWMHQLRDAGVGTVSIGKLHFRSSADDNGFAEELLPMHVVGGVGWPIGLLRRNPPAYDAAADLAADIGEGTSGYTDYDLAITSRAEAWLRNKDRSGASTAKPWAAFVSLVSPHYPLVAPREFLDLYDPSELEAPVGREVPAAQRHPELTNVARFFDYDRHFDARRRLEAKAAYFGLVSFMDDCVGRILRALDDSGQADNTVIVYVSDHGDMLGDHGLWTKQVMYESSVGVPMIAAGPGVAEGRRVQTGTTLLDLAATALDATGVDHDEKSLRLPSRSLRTIAAEPDDADRTIFSEYHDGGSTTGTFMVRWSRWKYVHYVGYAPQLFDLIADPHELVDLVTAAPDSAEIEAAIIEGDRRLRSICDPETVNATCFADQARRIEELGGEEACLNAVAFNHTPAPTA